MVRRIVIGFAILAVAVAGLVWWFFLRDTTPPKNTERPVAASTQTPTPKGPAPADKAAAAPAPVLNATPAPAPAATPVAPVAKPAPVLASRVSTPARKPGQPREWQNFGRDKAYPTRAAAIADAPRVMRELGYPEEVIALLTEKMKRPGEFRGIVNGDMFEWMRSGPREIWRNDVLVNFQRPPTAGMGFYAESEEWSVEYQGVTWVTGIPKVCNNLYGYRLNAPRRRQCVEVPFNHKYVGGKVRWSIGSTNGPLADDECNRVRQGSGTWKIWGRECASCVPPLEYLERIFRRAAAYFHPHTYTTTEVRQTLRFSEEVWGKALNICLEDPDGNQTKIVHVRPEDWKGRHVVPIRDELWELYVPPE